MGNKEENLEKVQGNLLWCCLHSSLVLLRPADAVMAACAELHPTIIRITRPGRRAGCVRAATTCRTLWRMACPSLGSVVHPPPPLIFNRCDNFRNKKKKKKKKKKS